MCITYLSSQKTRRQKLNSYWVMNSLGDKLSTQQRSPPQSLKYKNMLYQPRSHLYPAIANNRKPIGMMKMQCVTIYPNVKVSGPFVETPRIFLCMQNINYAEILA